MPTNLPPEFFQIDKRYRAAETTEERIELLVELLGTIPKHKGTEKLRADYKTRLAKLRTAAQSQKGKNRHASTFHIPREGAGQVALIGGTNTGKSSLLRALTNAEPEVAPSPFTTWEPLPGMIEMEGVQVQLIDTPSLDRPMVEPELFELIRRADLLLLAVDLTSDPFQQLEDALTLLQSYRIIPEQLKPELELSALEEGPRKWIMPLVVIANKCDDPSSDLDCQVFCELTEGKWPVLPVSALNGRNLDQLKQAVLDRLDVIRVYAKPPGKDPDLNTPFVMKAGSTLEELGGRIHKDFLQNLKFARVWGKTVHDGQMVSREYVLQDGDIVELHV